MFFADGAQCAGGGDARSRSARCCVLARERLAWVLSAFYFLTFGGFVAFSIYLPTLLKDQFGLHARRRRIPHRRLRGAGDAAASRRRMALGPHRRRARLRRGLRRRRAVRAAAGLAVDAPFTVGALGCAALLGFGNGAVFKLVPQYFPAETGTVTGLVGAMGGLGGFFPPLLLGFFREPSGARLARLRAACARGAGAVARQSQVSSAAPAGPGTTEWRAAGGRATARRRVGHAVDRAADRRDRGRLAQSPELRSGAGHLHVRRRLRHVGRRLPLQRLARQAAHARVLGSRLADCSRARAAVEPAALVALTGTQHRRANVHRKRSRLRWWMHQCLFWGCMLAVAITFPLVFGWIPFRSRPDDQMTYVTYLFGFPAGEFPPAHRIAWLLFHGLDISAVLVLAGIALSLWRRMRDRGRAHRPELSRWTSSR